MKMHEKKLQSLLVGIMLAASGQAHAGIWDSDLSDAERAKLQTPCTAFKTDGTGGPPDSCQVVREVARSESRRSPRELEAPIWRELTIYQLVNGTPTQVAAAFSDYPRYKPMFTKADMEKAVVTLDQFPFLNVHFSIRIKFAGLNLPLQYSLDNHWAQDAGGYHVNWTLLPFDQQESLLESFQKTLDLSIVDMAIQAADNLARSKVGEALYWIEGRHDIEPVSIEGKPYALVKYYNYISPKLMRGTLDSDKARADNKRKLSMTVDLLRTWVETDPQGALQSQVDAFCARWKCLP